MSTARAHEEHGGFLLLVCGTRAGQTELELIYAISIVVRFAVRPKPGRYLVARAIVVPQAAATVNGTRGGIVSGSLEHFHHAQSIRASVGYLRQTRAELEVEGSPADFARVKRGRIRARTPLVDEIP